MLIRKRPLRPQEGVREHEGNADVDTSAPRRPLHVCVWCVKGCFGGKWLKQGFGGFSSSLPKSPDVRSFPTTDKLQ